MPHYKLYYFNFRANGELSRLIFAAAGVDYEDIRLDREKDWPALKNEMPFGQLPVLEVDGKRLAQSRTINRYLAQQFGLAGKTPWEEALVSSIADQQWDFFVEIFPFIDVWIGAKEGDKVGNILSNHFQDQLYKDILLPARDKFYGFMKKFLDQSKSGYLVGDGLTMADIYVSEMTTSMSDAFPGWTDGFPEIEAHKAKVGAHPGIAKWLATRPPALELPSTRNMPY